MEFKGTKGKWKTNNENVFYELGGIICSIAEQDIHNKDIESIANAKLIASAPEMFELLKKIIDEKVSKHYFEIEQLLNKITQ